MGTRDIQIFDQQSQKDKYVNNIQKQYIVPEHIKLKRLHQLFGTMNVPSNTKKPIRIIFFLKEVEGNTHLIKLNHFIAPVNAYL